MKYHLPILALILALSGCGTIGTWRDNLALKAGYTKKAQADAALVAAQQARDTAVAKAKEDVSATKDAEIGTLKAQKSAAAKGLYGISTVNKTLPSPTRPESLMGDFGEESWAALGHEMPTYQDLLDINARVAKDLDATKTSLADLKVQHDKAMADNQKLADSEHKAETDLGAAKDALTKTQTDYQAKVDAKEADLNKAANETIALEHARADDAKAVQAFKTKASLIVGAMAIACLLGAIYSPFLKVQLGLSSLVLFTIAGLIWYVTPHMVLIAGGVLLLGLVGWAVWEHNKGSKAELATYQALAEIKDKAPEVWAKDVAPVLASWQTKYVKAPDGAVTTVPDPSISAHIDAKLMAVGDK